MDGRSSLVAVAAFWMLAAGCTNTYEEPMLSQPVHSPPGAVEDVFFPTWGPGDGGPQAGVSGVLTERDRCLFLTNGSTGEDLLPLWESGYSYSNGALLDSSGQVVVREGEELYGAGGYSSDWQVAEARVGQPIPTRCRPGGVDPWAIIFDVRAGPPPWED